MFIYFHTMQDRLQVTVGPEVYDEECEPLDGEFTFELKCESPMVATLLEKALSEMLHEEMHRIRKGNYMMGWKDKTARKKKREIFAKVCTAMADEWKEGSR